MIFDMPECGGCRTCEIACSFKHLGKFNADVSSLQVLYRKDGPGYKIRLVEDGESDGRFSCDQCRDREIPECVEYCHEREKLKEILAEFKVRTSKNGEK
jgi:Fe-S-cluster-containing hydrogenase component 2